jgi:hypothetical protein
VPRQRFFQKLLMRLNLGMLEAYRRKELVRIRNINNYLSLLFNARAVEGNPPSPSEAEIPAERPNPPSGVTWCAPGEPSNPKLQLCHSQWRQTETGSQSRMGGGHVHSCLRDRSHLGGLGVATGSASAAERGYPESGRRHIQYDKGGVRHQSGRHPPNQASTRPEA